MNGLHDGPETWFLRKSTRMAEPLVFLNGRTVPASQAHLAVYDAGVVLGATVTELVRTFRKQLYRLEDHLSRLGHSLHYVRFDIGLSMPELGQTVRQLVAHNAGLLGPDEELGAVIFVTAGEYATYAGGAAGNVRTTPTVCAHTFPLPFELWAAKLQAGVHLVTPSIRHVPPQCYDAKMKCRSRMHYYLADQEARLVDPDASALLLDLEGNVAETSAANFLMVEEGRIVSPSLRNTLPGVSRATVIELAAMLNIPFEVRDFQPFDAINAAEAFLASTPYCLMPVTKINGIAVGSGRPGPIYQRLIEAWSQLVGFDVLAQIIAGAKRRTASAVPS
jgi:branched-subunit amino acid aminotransferase/4-amino-4-deoxychorismate lyase